MFIKIESHKKYSNMFVHTYKISRGVFVSTWMLYKRYSSHVWLLPIQYIAPSSGYFNFVGLNYKSIHGKRGSQLSQNGKVREIQTNWGVIDPQFAQKLN